MRKIILASLLTVSAFAEVPEHLRPNVVPGSNLAPLLENIDTRLARINEQLELLNHIILAIKNDEDNSSNIAAHILALVEELARANAYLRTIAWHQDHVLDAKPPVKKGP